MKSNKPSKAEFKIRMKILKNKYQDKNITKYLADSYMVTSACITIWCKSFGIKLKNGRPKNGE